VIVALALLAVVVAGAGVLGRIPAALIAAAAMAAPFALYLAAAPLFRGVGLLLAAPPLGAALLVRTRRGLAGGLVAAFALTVLAAEMIVFGAFRS